jgi:predicted dehydrogenase
MPDEKTSHEDQPNERTPAPPESRVGYAVVGVGKLTAQELLPAFRGSRFSRLRALVSNEPEKALEFAEAHGLTASDVYTYDDFDRLAEREDIAAIYIVLPNSLHREYTERAASMGKHVLCEKPLASTLEDAEAIVAACRTAGIKLMTAYRCQYTPQHWAARDRIQSGELGPIGLVQAINSQVEDDPDVWRLDRRLAGGGSLPDIGLYCLNTVRFLLAEEPDEVFAYQFSTPGDPRFREVEEAVSWTMRFPSGTLASCATSYNAARANSVHVHGVEGWINFDPAFAYQGLEIEIVRKTSRETLIMDERDQFALEIDHFSRCILDDQTPFTPGEEGLQDQRIMAAIYQSASEGRPIPLERHEGRDVFRGPPPERD